MDKEEPQTYDHLNVLRQQFPPGYSAAIELVKELNEEGKPIGSRLVIEHRRPDVLRKERSEGKKRAHTFNRLRDLIGYLNRYGTDHQVVVAINLNELNAEAILDQESAHEVERITYKPLETAPFKRLKKSLARMSLDGFITFLRENRNYIVPEQRDEIRLLTGQLKVTKAIETFEGTGPRDTFGEIVKLTFKGRSDPEERVELPETLRFRVRPFVDSPSDLELEVFVDLKLSEGTKGSPVFTLSAPSIDDLYHEAMVDAESVLSDGTKQLNALITFGKLEEEAWTYLGFCPQPR